MSSVAVGRLRSIANTVRQLPTFYRVPGSIAGHYFLIVDKGAAFIREAESLGAFQGDSIYGRIGEKLAHPSCHQDDMIPIAARKVPGWKLAVWYAVVDTLAPELIRVRSRSIVTNASGENMLLVDTSEEEAEIVARAIEAEATRIEAVSATGSEPVSTQSRKVQSTNDDRDGWMYEQKKAGQTHSQIRYALTKEHSEWDSLDTEQAVGQAIDRYCKRKGISPLRRKR